MGMLVVIFGVLIIAFGFFITIKGARINQEIRKYEFENRTDGGTVKFKDFDSSLEHNRKQMRAKFVQGLGLFIAVIGAFVVASGLVMLH